MTTDFYTKFVLTIIAVCLTVLTLKNIDIIPSAYANESKDEVNPIPIPVKNYGLVPLNSDGSIDVNIKSSNSEMDVNITNISTSDELEVDIDEVGGYSTYGTVPVKIQ